MPLLPHWETISVADYASGVLDLFERPTAQKRVDALLYMTVGAARIKIVHDVTLRMRDHLRVGDRMAAPSGLLFEGILGDFGLGKIHIGYLLNHNELTSGTEMLVSHVHITGEAGFQRELACILRSMRIAGHTSSRSFDIELSTFIKLYDWAGKNPKALRDVSVSLVGNLPPIAATDFADSIVHAVQNNWNGTMVQNYIENWVARATPKRPWKFSNRFFEVSDA